MFCGISTRKRKTNSKSIKTQERFICAFYLKFGNHIPIEEAFCIEAELQYGLSPTVADIDVV